MLHEISFMSFNKRDEVQAWIYVPAAEPKGVVQLVHGFCEHSRRYLHTIVRFMDAGYIVAADDHVGHGRTAVVNDSWGNWGDKGYHTMMEDEHTLKELVCEKYPGLLYFFFGHSMGSFIIRDYITKYGNDLAGVILSGTTGVYRGAAEALEKLEKAVAEGRWAESEPSLGFSMVSWLGERCGVVKNGQEWCCSDIYVQQDHIKDPLNVSSRPISIGAMCYFTQMMENIKGTEWAEKVPKELPVYNIAGDQDPVGEYGKGVCEVTNWLVDTGHKVKMKLYSGYRHEILNYRDIRDQVEDGIVEFMDEIIAADNEKRSAREE